jgi:hypothetical protein
VLKFITIIIALVAFAHYTNIPKELVLRYIKAKQGLAVKASKKELATKSNSWYI